ncbi:hypothetical protein N658DRAFT_535707 [Parathielavia hyrcaniae]|uniref:Uncharacterized protein n=1 Tax=Parathielavia hyrcaniae TaxID=113614 RepID=A0AAN6PZ29_9PEZI|nr:hypothetical protein N658DRAFT_535707 [Parathielavia hyrcaniae]
MDHQGVRPEASGAHPGGNALSCANPQCHRREGLLRAEVDRRETERLGLVQDIADRRADINRLENEKRALSDENRVLREKLAGVGQHHERTWPDELRAHLRNNHPDVKIYACIYRLCCKEENMSVRREEDDFSSGSESESDELEVAHPRQSLLPGQNAGSARRDESPIRFEQLPWDAQFKVLTFVLRKEGLVHCLSRLDPFVHPEDFPSAEALGEHRSGFKKLFFWGKRECSMSSDGHNPNEVLGVLGVSKRFYFIGAHIFYGLNTFAFSSLGEFGRFCQGIGLARLARIQHMELLAQGHQYLTAPADERGKSPFSRRSYPFLWLADMYRLKTLVVHINESGTQYVRRESENPAVKRFMAAKTAGQPNRRMTRALRCVQGIDWVYQLRGMQWIRFYDFNKALKARRDVRVQVADWSFVEDRQEHSELQNLDPLLPAGDGQSWKPSDEDWELVKGLFVDSNGRCSYDDLRKESAKRDADMASYLSVTTRTPAVDVSSGSDTSDAESGSDKSDGTESNSLAESAGSASSLQRRPRRPGFLSELFVSDGGSDQDSDSDISLSSSSDDKLGNLLIIEIPSDSDDIPSDSDSDSGSDSDMDSSPDESSDPAHSDRSRPHSSSPPESTLTGTPNNNNTSHDCNAPAKRNSPPLFAIPERPANRTPALAALRARRESTATSGLFMSPGPARPSSQTPMPRARRESTTTSGGLFVSPGPSNPNPLLPIPNSSPNLRSLVQNPTTPMMMRHRRESTASGSGGGLFVTPGPSLLPRHNPPIGWAPKEGTPGSTGTGMRWIPRQVDRDGQVRRGGDDDDDDDNNTSAHSNATHATASTSVVVDLTGEDEESIIVDLTGDDDDAEDADMSGYNDNRNGNSRRSVQAAAADSLFGGDVSEVVDLSSDTDGEDSDVGYHGSALGSDRSSGGVGAHRRWGGGRNLLAGVQDLESESSDEDDELDSGLDSNSDDDGDDEDGPDGAGGGGKRGWGGETPNGGSPKRARLEM